MASTMMQILSLRLPCLELTFHLRARRLAPRLAVNPSKTQKTTHIFPPYTRNSPASVSCFSSSSPPPEDIQSTEGGVSAPQDPQQWKSLWRSLLARLYDGGHYRADPHVSPGDIQSDPAAIKRAVLSFSRQRADILSHLSIDKIADIVRAGLPQGEESDRKARNAYRRLEASFVKRQPLPPGDGGPADLQDVLRMVLALASATDQGTIDDLTVSTLAAAAGELLPEVLAGIDLLPPEGDATLSEKAKNMERMINQKKTSGRGTSGSKAPWARSKFD